MILLLTLLFTLSIILPLTFAPKSKCPKCDNGELECIDYEHGIFKCNKCGHIHIDDMFK